MKSPFLGMNLWLEGYLWPDVQNRLAQVIAEVAVLYLGKVLNIIFEPSLYHLSIDYKTKPAPPAFSEQDWTWIKEIINAHKKSTAS